MALSFDHATKRIVVPQTDAQPLLIQDLINAIRDEEASVRGVAYDQIAQAAGKDDLGGGVTTGITLTLLSTWKLSFASGAYQASITGGNLAGGLDRIDNTGSPQVLINSSAASTAVATSGSSGPSAAAIAAAVLEAIGGSPVPVNVRYVNGVEITGTGAPGDTWGPA